MLFAQMMLGKNGKYYTYYFYSGAFSSKQVLTLFRVCLPFYLAFSKMFNCTIANNGELWVLCHNKKIIVPYNNYFCLLFAIFISIFTCTHNYWEIFLLNYLREESYTVKVLLPQLIFHWNYEICLIFHGSSYILFLIS